jgi:hypothetical protein
VAPALAGATHAGRDVPHPVSAFVHGGLGIVSWSAVVMAIAGAPATLVWGGGHRPDTAQEPVAG